MNETGLRSVFARAIEMNRETFAGGEFDLAYHALMVALHCGQRLNDIELLTRVEGLAKEQMKSIDDQHPDYIHSSSSARQRGHSSIFLTAAKHARTRIIMLDRQAAQKKLHEWSRDD